MKRGIHNSPCVRLFRMGPADGLFRWASWSVSTDLKKYYTFNSPSAFNRTGMTVYHCDSNHSSHVHSFRYRALGKHIFLSLHSVCWKWVNEWPWEAGKKQLWRSVRAGHKPAITQTAASPDCCVCPVKPGMAVSCFWQHKLWSDPHKDLQKRFFL